MEENIPDLFVPSRIAWRRLCDWIETQQELSKELLSNLEQRLAHWPKQYRLLPGRWLYRLLDGAQTSGLELVTCLDAVLFGEKRRHPYAWADCERLSALSIFRLYDEELGDIGATALAKSLYLTKLTELTLSTNITNQGARALALSNNLSQLETLRLHRNQIGAQGISDLVSSSFTCLRALHLGRNKLDKAAIEALCNATWRLEKLDLDCSAIDGSMVEMLCQSGCLSSLKELNLSNNQIGTLGCRALADCEDLQQLEVLFLHNCNLQDEDAAVLLRSTSLRSLKNFALSQNHLSEHTVKKLASCELLSGLTELDVCHNPFEVTSSEETLKTSPNLQNLKRLCV